jgi:hypothetical protein
MVEQSQEEHLQTSSERIEVICMYYIVYFWDESNKGAIDDLQIGCLIVKILAQLVEVMFDDVPVLLMKNGIETMWVRSSFTGHLLDCLIYFLISKGFNQMSKVSLL